ncbi:Glycoside hydrolase, 38 vacuolar alpha mannosidase [Tilletia horrida]|uniref:alpha-mannosidase n=1 Tax=Tilletia horrida TaxID=155126 RepID=A0AAN6GBJ3_9BASI|nr:Glycoside hydrolase, 38 vacuolar alpha mannosidase [Tilletia horrida]
MASKPAYPLLSSETARPVRGPAIRSLQERRLKEFIGGQFADYNLASVLFKHRTDVTPAVKLARWDPPAGTKPNFKEATAKDKEYVELKKGDKFGPSWTNHWVKFTFEVPKEWRDEEDVQIEFDPSCEALIYTEDGIALQGITGGHGEDRRVDYPLTKQWRKGRNTFYIEVSCNGMFGQSVNFDHDPDPDRYFKLASADLVVKDPVAWGLMWDFETLQQLVEQMPKDSIVGNKALWAANEIQDVWRKNDPKTWVQGRKIAEEVLGAGWAEQGAKVWEDVKGERSDNALFAIGHTHIDTAWLWPFTATQQKVARSWSTQLSLMERFEEHRFTASTAQQYFWLEQLYPELFKRVQASVKDGKFFPIGGTWVECDANMPSGEGFVRQFLYGQRFFETRFGKRCNIFWLPDTFGYNAQIPQIARNAGADYFFTQKLSWNNIDKFPHNSFMWTGLDGTQILATMTAVDNYNSQVGIDDIRKGVWNNKNLNVQPSTLLLFGFGDGGGGPTDWMLQRLRRIRALWNNGYKEVPKVTIGQDAPTFYDNVRKNTHNGMRLPTWNGEIYLEFHRGVYTSHGSIKKGNRTLEILMHNVEWLTTLASIKNDDYKVPKEEIDEMWQNLLLCHFHDCLPGSSIRMVYDDIEKIYANLRKKGSKLMHDATHALRAVEKSQWDQAEDDEALVWGFNTLAIPRRELVSIPAKQAKALPRTATVQMGPTAESGDSERQAWVVVEDATGRGSVSVVENAAAIMRNSQAVFVNEVSHNNFELNNGVLSVKVSNGRISSIYDIEADRELIEKGQGAGLTIAEDYPPTYDAWEVELYHLNTTENIKFDRVRISEAGPWRATLTLEANFSQSKVRLDVSLDALPAAVSSIKGAKNTRSLLRFDATIDWHEKHRFLKFEVPSTLRSDTASYETQFGITKRPTTRNTTWEAAKFEVCGHRFSDLSETRYGLAILSDSKYGFSTEGGTMRLSLLKAATYPDSKQDMERHTFSFGLLPHLGTLADSAVVHVARIFNNPVEASQVSAIDGQDELGLLASPATAAAPIQLADAEESTVVLDTLKRGEQDFDYYGKKGTSGKTVVVRLYESSGAFAKTALRVALPVKKIALTNLLEDELQSWSPSDAKLKKKQRAAAADAEEGEALDVKVNADGTATVQLDFRAFEIKTLKFHLA